MQKNFLQSQDILDDVVQDLSALRAAITDDSESSRVVDTESEVKAVMKNQRKRLFKSLGVEVGAGGPRSWWKVIGLGLRTMIEWIINRLPKGGQVVKLLNRDWIMATLASAHLTLFAAFGVWVWCTIYHFGDCDSFTRDTRLAIIPGVNIRVTSPLRFWFIVLYIICLIPFLNIIFIGALELLTILIFRRIFSPGSQIKDTLGGFIILTLFVQAYFVVTTEFTIRDNRHLLVESAQEDDWTFGQTLAVALVAIPLVDVVKQSWEERNTVWDILTKYLLRRGKHC